METSLSRLKWPDYVVLATFLITSLGIGLYHALTGGRQKTVSEFIMADRSLAVLPTSISLLVSFQSALSALGLTAEMYLYGSQHLLMVCVVDVIGCFIAERVCVPWIYPLKLVSIYEYFEMRFHSKSVRVLAAFIGILSSIVYMGTAMFAPSLALQGVTGLPLHFSIPAMAIVAITYTTLGGMRAVIWTDVFQFCIMLSGLLAVLIKGVIIVGGFDNVIHLSDKEGRIIWSNFSPDPTERHTFFGYIFGLTPAWVFVYGLNQASAQRYSATTSLTRARMSILVNIPALVMLELITCFSGLVIVAYYSYLKCDPLANGEVENANQLLPYLVTQIFSSAPGFAGLFLAALYGGALSSVSSSLSGAAANCWEDMMKWRLNHLSESTKALISRFLVFVFGVLATGLSFLAAAIPGPVTQIASVLFSTITGPQFGLFMLGGLSRVANWKGALIGTFSGLCINLWLTLGALGLQRNYSPLTPLPLSGCPNNNNTLNETFSTSTFSPSLYITDFVLNKTIDFERNFSSQTEYPVVEGFNKLYSISYVWLTLIGFMTTLIVGTLASLPFRNKEVEESIEELLLIQWKDFFTCSAQSSSARKCYNIEKGLDKLFHG